MGDIKFELDSESISSQTPENILHSDQIQFSSTEDIHSQNHSENIANQIINNAEKIAVSVHENPNPDFIPLEVGGIKFTPVENLKNQQPETCNSPKKEAPKLIFEHEFEIFLKHSNAYGNVYFSNYFDWQGVLREAWFCKKIVPNMFELEGAFVTKTAHADYKKEMFPFMKIIGTLTVKNMRLASFDLIFNFYESVSKELVCSGYQSIAFMGKNKKPTRLPESIRTSMMQYEV